MGGFQKLLIVQCCAGPRAGAKREGMAKYVMTAVALVLVCALMSGLYRLAPYQNPVSYTPSGARSRLALRESLGFIDDTDSSWRSRKRIHHEEVHQSAGEYPAAQFNSQAQKVAEKEARNKKASGSEKSLLIESEKIRYLNSEFYQSRWEPTFHCALAERLGPTGDGGKWVCDPGSIGPDCLVYSLGSNNDFRFEVAVHERLPHCEIHTFDHTIDAEPSNKPPYVHFHHWGLATTHEQSAQKPKMFTLKQLAAKLGHSDRMIEIMKVDIESAEVDAVDSWAHGPIARQILVETHLHTKPKPPNQGWPKPQELDGFLQKLTTKQHYAVISKEPNIIAARDGGHCCAEYSLLKMAPSFFENVQRDTPIVDPSSKISSSDAADA